MLHLRYKCAAKILASLLTKVVFIAMYFNSIIISILQYVSSTSSLRPKFKHYLWCLGASQSTAMLNRLKQISCYIFKILIIQSILMRYFKAILQCASRFLLFSQCRIGRGQFHWARLCS